MKSFDVLSEHVFLQNKGKSRYKTTFGGIVTLLIIIITILCFVYFSLNLFNKENPITNTTHKYQNNAGKISFDTDNMFHIIGIFGYPSYQSIYKPNIINIIGYYVFMNITLKLYEYDYCNYDIDYNDVYNYDRKKFEEYICIRKVTDLKTNQTIIKTERNQKNFTYPSLEYGVSSTLGYTSYAVVINQCQNNTFRQDCLPMQKIKDTYNRAFFSLEMIDNYFVLNDYTQPIKKFNRRIGGILYDGTINNNHVNINSVKLTTDDGFLLKEQSTIDSYHYSFNEKTPETKSNMDDRIASVSFWIDNTVHEYNRQYTKIQDVMAQIGGFLNLFRIVGILLCSIFSKFYQISYFEKFLNSQNISLSNEFNPNTSLVQLQNAKSNVTRKEFISINRPRQNPDEKVNKTRINQDLTIFDFIKSFIFMKHNYRIKEMIRIRRYFLEEENLFNLHIEMLKLKKFVKYNNQEFEIYSNEFK